MDPLLERQAELELDMRRMGVERYRAAVKAAEEAGDASATQPISLLMRRHIDGVGTSLRDWIAEVMAAKRGRKAVAAKCMKDLDPHVVAFIGLRSVFDTACVAPRKGAPTLQRVAVALGRRIEDEARWAAFEEAAPGLFGAVSEGTKSRHARHRRTVLNMAMSGAEVPWDDWTDTERLHTGLKVIEIITEVTGLVEIRRDGAKNRTDLRVVLTEAASEWVTQAHARCEALLPVLLPFIIPPRDWTSPFTGAFHTKALRPLTLVKTRKRAYLDELAGLVDEMPEVYRSVNALQRTPWTINQQVLEVAKLVWDRGVAVGSMPPRADAPVPTSPVPDVPKEQLTEQQQEDLREWKRRATEVHDFNNRIRSKRVQVVKTLQVAEQFATEAAIYFPYQLDFRGRVYAVPMFLNPQGADLAKALLMFAEGMPIEDDVAAGYLAVHGANCFGYDKASLDDRVQWVVDHEQEIMAVAADPTGHMWWAEADEPWCFLAFCFEWAALKEQGYGFVSHLPVAMDASCSGIQHFSAMLRDPVGGAAVNLVPSGEKQDIYQQVADRVTAHLRLVLSTGEKDSDEVALAEAWLAFEDGAVGRKATKRSVMVLPYGGTQFSCRQFISDYLREQLEAGKEDTFGRERHFDASAFLAKLVWTSIGEVVVAARQVMSWLQKAAKELAKDGRAVSWRAPSGFPVLQSYFSMTQHRVRTRFGESTVFLSLAEETKTLDTRRQANGISPNFVHANDAAHLCLTVDLALDNGIEHFAMIHDSFGTHAANTHKLAACIREAFVDMYEEVDVLAEFRKEVTEFIDDPSKVPAIPPRGDLDIAVVRESEFFFA
jgi:DNA-directed RNA polymerase